MQFICHPLTFSASATSSHEIAHVLSLEAFRFLYTHAGRDGAFVSRFLIVQESVNSVSCVLANFVTLLS
jgi:hypothetical protein